MISLDRWTVFGITRSSQSLHVHVMAFFWEKKDMKREAAWAAWSSGLGHWVWNLEVPGSNPPPFYYLDLFSVAPSSTPRPCCVNCQLVSLPPVGILNSLLFLQHLVIYLQCPQLAQQYLNKLDAWIKVLLLYYYYYINNKDHAHRQSFRISPVHLENTVLNWT